jgi:hypothetical protein
MPFCRPAGFHRSSPSALPYAQYKVSKTDFCECD